ncbi:heparin lyase I family protein, partial [Bradyrhizobium sp. ARR65]|uniref:heparin lyase I family protein n=1 Tax=Bradyrhizobium sp. ARR65 TaxID=1040989 RepID=UPI000AB17989
MATTQPNITSFSSANGATVTVDGMNAQVENASRSYSLTEPDSNTLRFEVQSGDAWPNDVRNGNTSERSEIDMIPTYSPNTQINVSYGFTLEPGAANTASWMVLGQIHNTILGGSPPVAVAMYGEHMVVIARGPSGAENDVYTDPNPIQRGHQYQMNMQVDFGSNGNGTLKVWRDGVEIVNYSGPLGSGTSNESYYWKEGVYRAPATETVAADYSNLQITTGPAAAPISGTTTSSSGGTSSGGTSSSDPTSGGASVTTPTGTTSSGTTTGSAATSSG